MLPRELNSGRVMIRLASLPRAMEPRVGAEAGAEEGAHNAGAEAGAEEGAQNGGAQNAGSPESPIA